LDWHPPKGWAPPFHEADFYFKGKTRYYPKAALLTLEVAKAQASSGQSPSVKPGMAVPTKTQGGAVMMSAPTDHAGSHADSVSVLRPALPRPPADTKRDEVQDFVAVRHGLAVDQSPDESTMDPGAETGDPEELARLLSETESEPEPRTQSIATSRPHPFQFIIDTRNELRAKLGREPTPEEMDARGEVELDKDIEGFVSALADAVKERVAVPAATNPPVSEPLAAQQTQIGGNVGGSVIHAPNATFVIGATHAPEVLKPETKAQSEVKQSKTPEAPAKEVIAAPAVSDLRRAIRMVHRVLAAVFPDFIKPPKEPEAEAPKLPEPPKETHEEPQETEKPTKAVEAKPAEHKPELPAGEGTKKLALVLFFIVALVALGGVMGGLLDRFKLGKDGIEAVGTKAKPEPGEKGEPKPGTAASVSPATATAPEPSAVLGPMGGTTGLPFEEVAPSAKPTPGAPSKNHPAGEVEASAMPAPPAVGPQPFGSLRTCSPNKALKDKFGVSCVSVCYSLGAKGSKPNPANLGSSYAQSQAECIRMATEKCKSYNSCEYHYTPAPPVDLNDPQNDSL
jgi:hypothetical protein